uniref:RNA-directed DNA polymerase n=1 Tax=Strongyloides papillosus TaxID=174720 RepID=A0A0N5CAI3_STREA
MKRSWLAEQKARSWLAEQKAAKGFFPEEQHPTELQIIQPTSTWRFGDGPLLASFNSILHEALPKIVLFVNHTPILTLVDTGASINVISNRIFPTSANGTKLLLSQKAIIKLPIDNATYTITCYVSPKIDHDLILGRPGLEAIGDLKISWAKGAIQIGEHNLQLRNTYPLAFDEEVILEPSSHNILTPSIRHAPPSIEKEHVFPKFDPHIKGTNALITYQQVNPVFDNKINLLIDNCGNNPVRLPRNTILGHVALVEKINCHEIKITNEGYSDDEADIVERLPPYSKNKLPPELSIKDLRKLVRVDQQGLPDGDRSAFYKILWQYRECFYEFNSTPGQYTGPEKLQLQTIPHNIPKPIRHTRYTVEKENEIAKQVNDMLQNDMIEPSRTPYLSRINLIKKKNDEWRFVVDFRLINKLIQAQNHHIPRIDSILDKAAGKKFYTSLDLKNGFHQLTLDKSSRHLTGFPTHMGIFQYKKIPMGLVGSPDFFNHVMEKIFSTSNNFVYLDDILLTSNTASEHLLNIERALAKAVEVGLRFSLSKCSFFQTSLEYLGFIVSRNGIKPNPDKTRALYEKPIPTNEKELRAFLGAANYYRKFIPYYSNTAASLYDIINNFVWTSKHTEAFKALKRSILGAVTLAAPDPQEPYTIFTDASTQGLGAALVQNGRPIAFASRTLRKAETLYAPVQLEALGLVYALKQFNPYIYGKRTTVQTDQKSLLSLMTKKDVSNILDRYKTYIMGYDLDIKYVKGADNTVADYLSRQVYNINLTETIEDFSDVFPKVTGYLQYPFVLGNFFKYFLIALAHKEEEQESTCPSY